ncbi:MULTISPECIES: glycosyltransferase family 4 protein [unclassified Roseofilum]|uniref:glycosyltransferase family 4 protein n=1 Tax=unclassified Roseofilum TaxID=2620099 RepID=UPI000E9A1C73|nr:MULTISPECIES: glycosyltransferase family 4 protein [unclassified Roseofilum]MBP0011134.1 glycosyltransferase family 4 protein [Roseofilum sp. Belize Diploria]MBP0034663.1 glycosyltransferase family 4 protein [Roseofilum sp. Belize BBD 4]MBP0041473.1 glycosyltransferase family 4 protein [Roseofilum sp. SBFL]HBQ96989.1 glycosyltransferase family 1 protein [Cyanobacteria bacterium UBA11691]
MKIVLVCTEKLPVPCVRGGAIQTYIDGILPYLSQEHDVTVFSVSDPNLRDQEIRNGIRYQRATPGDSDFYYQEVANFVAQESFDWVIFYNRPKYLPMVADAAPNSRFLLSMHNEMFHAKKITPELAHRCLDRVDRVVTVSQFIADGIANLFPGYEHKLQPVYAGVDLERFQPRWASGVQERRSSLLAEQNLEDRKVVLYVGRLTDKKGPHILLSAFPDILEQHPSAILLLVGSKWYGKNEENEYVRTLKKQAQELGDAVRLTGFVSPDRVQDYFLLGDIFVCASQWQEPLARVHYEAMATGLCILTTVRGGNAEVIIPEKNGLLITDYENPDAFSQPINSLLSNLDLAEDMGRNGRHLSEINYSWSRVASDILSILDR